MSWGFNRMGKAPAVSVVMNTELSKQKCNEPEESIKADAMKLVDKVLASWPANVAVRVDMQGSQHGPGPDSVVNQVRIQIDPLNDFVE